MIGEKRKTGIDVIGDVPWGTHFCQFYQTKEDLIDILVPYFKTGLENNEFCMWVTSEPLSEKEAKEAIRKAVPDFDRYLRRGQIEIVPHTEWYLKDGAFNLQRVLKAWIDKLNQALTNGYDGIRVTGNTAWLEKRDWRRFTDYEEEVNSVIGKYRMLAICTYSLDKCGASEIIDVVKNHQFALIRRQGKWELIESSERKRAEEEIRKVQERFSGIFNSSKDAIGYATLEGVLLDVNDSFRQLTGYSKEELLAGKRYQEITPQEYQGYEAKIIERILRTRNPEEYEKEYIRKDGSRVPILLTTFVVNGADGKPRGLTAIIKDITERKLTELALRASEAKYRGLVRNVKLGVFRSTPGRTGRFLEVNPAMEEITGYSRQELLQMNVSELYVHPEKREAVLGEIASARGKTTKELRLRKKDGTEMVVSDTKVAVRDNAGRIIYFDGIMEDITERKLAEGREKELQQELNRCSRLASIGELAAGVAHELNNPLTAVLGFSERLLRKSTDEDTKEGLEIIHDEALRMAKVVQNLLTFARRREPKKEYSDINDILQKTLELRGYELTTSNIEVVTDLAPGLPQMMVDFFQIQEVFLNIILNAEQALTEAHGGGKLTIKTQEIKDYIRISFTNDGPGIPVEHFYKVFDPFFTTREERGGTGLGLSACHGIVTEHGGKISAKSKPGKGATFFVELPLSLIGASLVHTY